MKLKGYIFFIFAIMLLSSCIKESFETTGDIQEISGVISIGNIIQGGEAAEKLHTIRFLVFKDVLTSTKLELNILEDMPPVTSGDEITEFNVLLEVSYRASGSNEKIVFAIVNEPAAMTSFLDGVTSYSDLQNLELDFAHFLNSEHTALSTTGKGLPMTGMIQTDKVFPTIAQAETNRAELEIERAVARVELYLRKEAGVTIDLTTASQVTLEKTYNKQPFLYHTTGSNTFGRIQTVPAFELNLPVNIKTWNPAAIIPDTTIPDSGEGVLLCTFYTPERTCSAANNADKLSLSINLVSSDGSIRPGEIVLDKFIEEGDVTEKEIDTIRRNNSYRIIANIEARDLTLTFTLVVQPWQLIEIPTYFN